jgi:predicted nucleotidyltransferase
MRITDKDIALITNSIGQADIDKIILFGSMATGKGGYSNDIDLIVVTSDPEIPSSFSGKMRIVSEIDRRISDIRRNIPIDLIVFTRGMYQKFNELNNSFCREIKRTGQILYERNHEGLA